MAPGNLQQPAETVDILPTAAAMLGLPGGVGKIDGHCLATVAQCPSGATVGTERGQR
jgi:arylsulfatase A-like enzyme